MNYSCASGMGWLVSELYLGSIHLFTVYKMTLTCHLLKFDSAIFCLFSSQLGVFFPVPLREATVVTATSSFLN